MKLRVFLMSTAMLLIATGAIAEPQSNIGGMRTDEENEVKIRALYDGFEAAWNRHDVKALVANWTIDGDHIEPDGREANGRDAVEELLTKEHASVFKETTLDLNIDDVWFVTANVALVDGGYKVSGARDLQGNEIPARDGHYTAVLLKENDRWSVAASRLMIPATLPYKGE
jgi:uncharacterized protein (TIGR02246 family)